jgi:hypothetical protein
VAPYSAISISTTMILLLVAFAGCLENALPSSNDAPTDDSSLSSTSTKPPATPSTDPADPQLPLASNILRLQDCKGILTLNEVPRSIVQTPGINTWTESPYPIVELRIEIHLCNRISVAGFERGPIALVLETHNNRTAPAKCLPESTQIQTEVLHKAWLSDDEIVETLAAKFGMPTGFLQELKDVGSSLGYRDEIAFKIAGRENALRISIAEGVGSSTQNAEVRFYWNASDGKLGLMDFHATTTSKSGNLPITIGSIAPPLLASAVGDPVYVGYGGSFANSDATGTIHIYGDAKCEN